MFDLCFQSVLADEQIEEQRRIPKALTVRSNVFGLLLLEKTRSSGKVEERGWHCDIPRPVREFGLRLGDVDRPCGRERGIFVRIQRPGTLEGSESKHLVWTV